MALAPSSVVAEPGQGIVPADEYIAEEITVEKVMTATSSQPVDLANPPESYLFNNCWQFIKDFYHSNIPSTKTIQSNLKKEYGDIAVFYYPNSTPENRWHYAKTVGLNKSGSFMIDEANYKKGKRTQRELTFDNYALKGFYDLPK